MAAPDVALIGNADGNFGSSQLEGTAGWRLPGEGRAVVRVGPDGRRAGQDPRRGCGDAHVVVKIDDKHRPCPPGLIWSPHDSKVLFADVATRLPRLSSILTS